MSTPTRRQFLGAAAAATVATSAKATPSTRSTAKNVIFLHMVGGPSQLDTFDPKPDAPSTHRSPFGTIPTRVPGVHVTELFPKLAGIADKVAFVRTLHHDAPPIHEAGFQLLHTGRLFRDGPEWPSVGTVIAHLRNGRSSLKTRAVVIPTLDVNTGASISHGQGDAYLNLEPWVWRGENGTFAVKSDCPMGRYGLTVFGQNCGWGAMTSRLGMPFVTVNQFPTVFDAPSWDCHADGGSLACDLGDYKDTVAPSFDAAFTNLVLDLETRGLLDETLVVAVGEFGRTPKRNSNGGRDHWAGCWTALLAGGGVQGGRVVGRSDAIASEPVDRSVTCPELVATIYHALGLHGATIPGPDGAPVPVIDAEPVRELF